MDWRPNVSVNGLLSQSAPALAVYDGQLHLVHRGDSDKLFHITYDGSGWARTENQITDRPGGSTFLRPRQGATDLLRAVHHSV